MKQAKPSTELKAGASKVVEAQSNSSERRAAAKIKDAEILFGENPKASTVPAKRPRVLSNAQDKDLKELATEKDTAKPNNANEVNINSKQAKNEVQAVNTTDGAQAAKEQRVSAAVNNTATKRALV